MPLFDLVFAQFVCCLCEQPLKDKEPWARITANVNIKYSILFEYYAHQSCLERAKELIKQNPVK